LAGSELVVCVSPDSNNSARKLFSALGGRITFAGAGDGFGQTLGLATCPPIAQPDIASAQIGQNSRRQTFVFTTFCLVLGANLMQAFVFLALY